MTKIGITRKIDTLGRVVIPKEMRRFYEMQAEEYVEILATEQGILIRNPLYEVREKKQIEQNR